MEARDWIPLASLSLTAISLGVTALVAWQHNAIKIALADARLEISELRGEMRERIARLEGPAPAAAHGPRLVNGRG